MVDFQSTIFFDHSLPDDDTVVFRDQKNALTVAAEGSLFGPNYVHQNALGQSGAELFKSTWHLGDAWRSRISKVEVWKPSWNIPRFKLITNNSSTLGSKAW